MKQPSRWRRFRCVIRHHGHVAVNAWLYPPLGHCMYCGWQVQP